MDMWSPPQIGHTIDTGEGLTKMTWTYRNEEYDLVPTPEPHLWKIVARNGGGSIFSGSSEGPERCSPGSYQSHMGVLGARASGDGQLGEILRI